MPFSPPPLCEMTVLPVGSWWSSCSVPLQKPTRAIGVRPIYNIDTAVSPLPLDLKADLTDLNEGGRKLVSHTYHHTLIDGHVPVLLCSVSTFAHHVLCSGMYSQEAGGKKIQDANGPCSTSAHLH